MKLNKINNWIKKHPSALISLTCTAVVIFIQWIIIYLTVNPLDIFTMEMGPTLLTVGAQVVAALYGVTLTGYIFFMDRLDQKAENDAMLEDIIILLKKRYHTTVLILSAICFIVMVLGLIVPLYNPESKFMPDEIYHFLIYETIFMVLVAVALIVYFIITVVDPDKLQRTSMQYKQKLSTSDTELGSLQEFLSDYEAIERLLAEKTKNLATFHLGSSPWKTLKHLKGKELMDARKILTDPLIKKMTTVSQYYSYMLFSQEMTVSKEMCVLAREVKNELEQIEVCDEGL